MILIADGGSTKTCWCLIEDGGKTTMFETEGYHPFFVNSRYIYQSLNDNIPQEIKDKSSEVSNLIFYSAGGGYSADADNILIQGIAGIFTRTEIKIETDLLAAARALLGRKSGFAAILGTGSNSCLYDGRKITDNIESLGFLLGDEGSGAYIGKKILSDYIRHFMPLEIGNLLSDYYQLTPEKALNALYESATPNRYCAKFAVFVKQHLQTAYCTELVYSNFDQFFENIVIHYKDYQKYSFNSIGSIAFYFKDILEQVVRKHHMKLGTIAVSSVEGLINYHVLSVK